MFQYWIPMGNAISAFVLMGCHVVALIAIVSLAQGKARVLGILGVIVLFLSTVFGALNGSVSPWLARTTGTNLDVYGLGSIAVSGVGAIGLVLLALAAVAARKRTRSLGGR